MYNEPGAQETGDGLGLDPIRTALGGFFDNCSGDREARPSPVGRTIDGREAERQTRLHQAA